MQAYIILDSSGKTVAGYLAKTSDKALSFYPEGFSAVKVSTIPDMPCPSCGCLKYRGYGYSSSGQPKRRCNDCGKVYRLNGFKPGMKRYFEE
jgi:transposase-like protein